MTKRTIVVTGASDGVGAAAVRELASRPDTNVVVVGRSPGKTKAVADSMGAESHVADFARLADVRALAATLAERYPAIDVLANNAGGVFSPRQVTEDGFEKTFQVNYLAPYLLTTLLLDSLRAGEGTVITTASRASQGGKVDLTDLGFERGWTPFRAYGTSKLENIMFARALQRRHGSEGIASASFHPGVVGSGFGLTGAWPTRFAYTVGKRFMLTNEQGADTLVWLATTKPGVDWTPGGYFDKRHLVTPPRQARDDALVDKLWDSTALLVS